MKIGLQSLLIVIAAALSLVSSCKSKEASSSSESTAIVGEDWTAAKVTLKYAEEGCEVLIVTNDGAELNPAQLDEAFHREGLAIYLQYQTTRMPHPNDCGRGAPILIYQIKKQ